MDFPTVPTEYVVFILALFIVGVVGYVLFRRKYFGWIHDLLNASRVEWKLFWAYLKLNILVTIGLVITFSGLTTTITLFDLTAFYLTATGVLFIIRAVHTIPLNPKTDAKEILQDLLAVVWLGAFIAGTRLLVLYFWSASQFFTAISPLSGIYTVNLSIEIVLKFFAAFLLPPILTTTALELSLVGYCKLTKRTREF